MSISLSEITVPSILAGLQVLQGLLSRAKAYATEHSIEPSALLECRLAADMFTFAQQVQTATDNARRGLERLADQEITNREDPAATFDALEARLNETIELCREMDSSHIDASVDRKFNVNFGPDITLAYTGKTYVLSFLLPNFYFHVTTAYSILRERGLQLGKLDYLGPIGGAYGVMPG